MTLEQLLMIPMALAFIASSLVVATVPVRKERFPGEVLFFTLFPVP